VGDLLRSFGCGMGHPVDGYQATIMPCSPLAP
jgi:hypothetical protein